LLVTSRTIALHSFVTSRVHFGIDYYLYWLEGNPPAGNGFNYFIWGGYLLYRSWPERTVFIDGQTDFYGEALSRQYVQVVTLTGDWESILEQYQVTWVLMPVDSALVKTLRDHPDWGVAYQDSTEAVLIIRDAD
jgi:hypothetical protein